MKSRPRISPNLLALSSENRATWAFVGRVMFVIGESFLRSKSVVGPSGTVEKWVQFGPSLVPSCLYRNKCSEKSYSGRTSGNFTIKFSFGISQVC